ncbi:cobyrinate a,c-diamide synthase [Ulvibacterium sp.]|uniref:cobyrinate a,c-diamide synthase n=1 Tax=Ulvibacterium sp. TaxID=2665914 RepID=UPI0026105FD4|nr:cobyrinate a,c-diamide synthase [Ulvibacterium sp.]
MNRKTDPQSRFIIAAPNSNAGKTTVTLGLLRLFREKGISVQPFKVGPDYIDPKFHYQACGKTGINLDLFMMSEPYLHEQLSSFGRNQRVSCIEGVMGLFDGARKAEGSTAELAIKMNLPVILVVDAKAVAYSVAPLIQGFRNFDKNLNLIGVIFNRVGSENHYSFLKEACDDIGIQSFGYVRRLENVQIPSRHLGLDITRLEQYEETIQTLATEMEQTLDWPSLLKETTYQSSLTPSPDYHTSKKFRFAIAMDEAFNFIYPHHIKVMEAIGSVTFFSPIRDQKVPESDFVYFPGGYPECHLEALSGNTSMLQSVRLFAENSGKIFAECGGMMYLGKRITDHEGNVFKMVGFFDFTSSMEGAKMRLGYREVILDHLRLKGHEFHYTTMKEQHETPYKATVLNAKGMEVKTNIFVKQKTMASYIHYHFGEENMLLNLIAMLEKQ